MVAFHSRSNRIIFKNRSLPEIFFILSLMFIISTVMLVNIENDTSWLYDWLASLLFLFSILGILVLIFRFAVDILIKVNLPYISNFVKKFKSGMIKKNIRLTDFFKRMMSPVYLFPVKLVCYSVFYGFRFIGKLIISLLRVIWATVTYPFKNLVNFLKSCFILGLVIYIPVSFFVMIDYIRTHYGNYEKMFCSAGIQEKLKNRTLRIVGGYSEGSGFFIDSKRILTNFHVIDGEPSPKIIFPDGSFITPLKMTGDKNADLAVLFTERNYDYMVMHLPDKINLSENERVISSGYPLGTVISGRATAVQGNYLEIRTSKKNPVSYIQTDINLVPGMSGGPLTDQCGSLIGINTMGLAGLSMFISADYAKTVIPKFTDSEVKKIAVDPAKSPEDAVMAFYTYLKARRMQDGYNLLSREYLKKTSFEEWTNRFKDILDVNIFLSEKYENTKDTARVKFGTKNWVEGETEIHYYEGTWQTVKEDGVYKMFKSNIKEVENPGWQWFYE